MFTSYQSKIRIGNAESEYLSIPANLASGMFLPLYKSGARIFSNSWYISQLKYNIYNIIRNQQIFTFFVRGAYGTGANQYGTDARSVDLFMRAYPESLIIFAAGNEGSDGYNTVVSPSVNKNGLAVGAGLNDANSFYMNADSSLHDLVIDFPQYNSSSSNFTILEPDLYNTFRTMELDSEEYEVTSSVDRLAYFSSMGPTKDGRPKPDVSAHSK